MRSGLLASLAVDLPSGPMIVCAIMVLGLLVFALGPRDRPDARA